jgi:hypothetical protein
VLIEPDVNLLQLNKNTPDQITRAMLTNRYKIFRKEMDMIEIEVYLNNGRAFVKIKNPDPQKKTIDKILISESQGLECGNKSNALSKLRPVEIDADKAVEQEITNGIKSFFEKRQNVHTKIVIELEGAEPEGKTTAQVEINNGQIIILK